MTSHQYGIILLGICYKSNTQAFNGGSPFVSCSYRVEVGYVQNKLNKLHQCDIPISRLSYIIYINYIIYYINICIYVLCQAGGICLATPSSMNQLQAQRLPAETHRQTIHPPCGHPQTLSRDIDVITNIIWSLKCGQT